MTNRNVYPEFGKKIRALREAAGITASDMAERVGVNRSYITIIERSIQGPPSNRTLDLMLDVLQLSDAERLDIYAMIDRMPDDIYQLVYAAFKEDPLAARCALKDVLTSV